MAVTDRQRVELADGTELYVQHLGAAGDDTAEFEVEPVADDDRRRWVLRISRFGGYEVVESFDSGVEVTVDEPDWFHELADRAV